MRKILLILFLLASNIVLSQQFNYTGNIYNAVDSGLSGVTVNLWTKSIVPYQISYPTYPSSVSYNTGTVVASSDDVVSGPFNIGFTFNFFGNNYSQFYICSNGWVGFSAGQTNAYTAAYIPNAGSPSNVIMADWEDLYPTSSNIYYQTVGTAPNRKLIVSFYNTPHYSCATLYYTFQFVLYEITNIIDINILSKPLCSGNLATQGLVNSTNTVVVPVGGRNADSWSITTPETIRFTPSTDTNWYIGKTVTTNTSGFFTFNPSGFDINNFQFKVEIPNVPLTTITTVDIANLSDLIFRKVTPNSKNYYQFDINNSGTFTVSDLFSLYAKNSGLLTSFTPNFRFFNNTEWNTIKTSTNNLKHTIPGIQNILIYPATNGGSLNYYCIRTGLKK